MKAKIGTTDKSPAGAKSAVSSSSTNKSPKTQSASRTPAKQASQRGSFMIDKTLALEPESTSDECGQIANEMIFIVYEKIEKVKSQIKAQTEIKRKLEVEFVKQEENVKDTKETIRKLERDKEKLEIEHEQLKKDCIKFNTLISESEEATQHAASEQLAIIKDLERKIEEYKARVEKEKSEIIDQRDKEIPIEGEFMQQKERREQNIKEMDRLMEETEKQAKIARLKEDMRVKKFKSTTKTLDVALSKNIC